MLTVTTNVRLFFKYYISSDKFPKKKSEDQPAKNRFIFNVFINFDLIDFVLTLFCLCWFWTYFSFKNYQFKCNFSRENLLSNLLLSESKFPKKRSSKSLYQRLANWKELFLSQEKYFKTLRNMVIGLLST